MAFTLATGLEYIENPLRQGPSDDIDYLRTRYDECLAHVDSWVGKVIDELKQSHAESATILESLDPSVLALEYECLVNPVWPMPNIEQCLEQLRGRGLRLGIVSNAQAMTRELFPALVGKTLGELGFEEKLQFFSYLYGESKAY